MQGWPASRSACSLTTSRAPATIWRPPPANWTPDRKSTRLNSSHMSISYAVFCLKKKKKQKKKLRTTQQNTNDPPTHTPNSFKPTKTLPHTQRHIRHPTQHTRATHQTTARPPRLT